MRIDMHLFLSAFIAWVIVFPIAMVKAAIDSKPKKRNAEREQLKKIAIERGHVVTAKLIKIQTHYAKSYSGNRQFESAGVYEYFYAGKRYIYKYPSDHPEMTMTLYFVSNPRKATVAMALKPDKTTVDLGLKAPISWPIVYLIVFAIVCAIIYM